MINNMSRSHSWKSQFYTVAKQFYCLQLYLKGRRQSGQSREEMRTWFMAGSCKIRRQVIAPHKTACFTMFQEIKRMPAPPTKSLGQIMFRLAYVDYVDTCKVAGEPWWSCSTTIKNTQSFKLLFISNVLLFPWVHSRFFSLYCFSSFIMCLGLDFFWFNLFWFQWTSKIYRFMSFTKLGAFFRHCFFFFPQILPALHSFSSICGTYINLTPLINEAGSLSLEF